MYRVILAAVDGSARSAGVLAAAVEIGARFGAEVHLFRQVAIPPEFPPSAPMPPDELPPLLEAEARRGLEALAGGRRGVVIEAPDLTAPQAWRAILAAAERLHADLIVIGSHGYGGWDRVVGTNASRIADHADRNVLIVHERHPPRAGGEGGAS